MLATFLVMGGALAELVLQAGDLDLRRLPMLTMEPDRASAAAGLVQHGERKADE
jgi:hypothetical protein